MPANYHRKTNRPYTKRGTPVTDRFWQYVSRGPGRNVCWLWNGTMKDGGYGTFKLRPNRSATAHRAAYILTYGEIGDSSIQVCHTCDNRRCVRPSHLFLGTALDNMRDCIAKGRYRGRPRRLSASQRAEVKRRRPMESLSMLSLAFGVSRAAIIKIAREP